RRREEPELARVVHVNHPLLHHTARPGDQLLERPRASEIEPLELAAQPLPLERGHDRPGDDARGGFGELAAEELIDPLALVPRRKERRDRRRQRGSARHGPLTHARVAAASAWSRSARMSSMCSMPTLSRIVAGPRPACRCSSADICRWVVEAGWQASDLASPRFTRRLKSLSASEKRVPASCPPRISNVMSEQARPPRYFWQRAWWGWS